ncbi:MAG TPA: maleylpyruvate isomerase family mycothiol-dependent enzyme [Streptosporangiaceae bacterium]
MVSYLAMENSRFLECLATDYTLLREASAAAGLEAAVPSCPGWAVTDLVRHVTEVYLHKVVAIRTGAWPDPWPPDLSGEQPLAAFDRAYRELTGEFASHPADSAALTWYKPDQTVGFWIRRMAQETVIHRMDAELAAGRPLTPAPDDLALDGIDEALTLFLGYGSASWPEDMAELEGEQPATEGGKEAVTVAAGPAAWTVRPTPAGVLIEPGADREAVAVVQAAPDPLLRWIWGRSGDEVVTITGDPAWITYLRGLIKIFTQ